jgi:hypothetical protein
MKKTSKWACVTMCQRRQRLDMERMSVEVELILQQLEKELLLLICYLIVGGLFCGRKLNLRCKN